MRPAIGRRALVGLAGLAVLAAVAVVYSTMNEGVLRTVTLRGPRTALPTAMAIDTRTHRAFVASADNIGAYARVAVLDTSRGALLRTVTAGTSAAGMLVDERTGRVFVADPRDETMWVLDARTGALLRTVAMGYMPNGLRGVVDPRTDRIFVWASGLRVLDARSGTILRTVMDVGDILAVDEQTGRVFDADDIAKRVSVLDARSGAILRTVTLGQAALQIVVSPTTGHAFVLGDRALWMLDARAGRVLRTLRVGAWPVPAVPSVTASGSELIVRLPTGRISLVDARRGSIIRTFTVGQSAGELVVDGRSGHIFVVDTTVSTDVVPAMAGRVWMIDTHNGAILRTIDVAPNSSAIALDERTERVFVTSMGAMDGFTPLGPGYVGVPVATGPGSVSVLDARSGALLRTVQVGANPSLVAVDERTGHAFAVGGGAVEVSDAWSWIPSGLRRRLPFLPPPPSSTGFIPARIAPNSVSMLDASR